MQEPVQDLILSCTSVTGFHRPVAIMIVSVPSSLVGDTGGVLFRVAWAAPKTGTTRLSKMGPRAGAMSTIKIEMSISIDRCKERTGKGANVVSSVINETKTIDVGIYLLFQVKEQSTEKNEKQTNCFQGDHVFVGQASRPPTT